ncbi:ABC transporter permease subunit [Pseudoroseomonas wenyumeiae]|uniref:ABC transporter permease n=1 Tax=Teichococcus wenyumeiae TaxID=2478470 RepID=A0A3A9JA56_9PROT|nr:ABC transporter permease [Pseudoroseomonas wenyumeiae]RKK02940.1 ABC transporter permease [Pseudoroseomonas wenyumeiae]RMI24527.1 ABC transporter permease subunit [Pseudoroseomonas wenyumeiae]
MAGLLRRLLALVPVLLGVTLASFLLTWLLPGDPAVFFANSVTADAATVAALRAKMGLDLPLWQQFLAYLAQLARGDLGQSIQTGQPVAADLLQRLPASAELTLAALGAALLLALPLGIAAALRPGSVIDHACRVLSVAGVALPSFVTGLLLIYVFYFHLGLAPEPIGRLDPFAIPPPRVTGFLLPDTLLAGDGAGFLAAARQLVLPAATMALFALAPLARMTRAAMLDVLGSDFIRAARAHGLRRRRIVLSYALRNALLPVVTTLGMVFSSMLGANVLVERVFAWPGIGSYALDALLGLDYAPVQGFMLVMAGLLVGVNLLVDLLCAIIDPRSGLLRDA